MIDKNAGALDARRPWLPAAVVKWIDERRGLWMYEADGPVRERWFHPSMLGKTMKLHFESVSIRRLLSPSEASQTVFRAVPAARSTVCWTAVAPGGRS